MRTPGPWIDGITKNSYATGIQKSSRDRRQRTVTEGAEAKDTASWQHLVKRMPLPSEGLQEGEFGTQRD